MRPSVVKQASSLEILALFVRVILGWRLWRNCGVLRLLCSRTSLFSCRTLPEIVSERVDYDVNKAVYTTSCNVATNVSQFVFYIKASHRSVLFCFLTIVKLQISVENKGKGTSYSDSQQGFFVH